MKVTKLVVGHQNGFPKRLRCVQKGNPPKTIEWFPLGVPLNQQCRGSNKGHSPRTLWEVNHLTAGFSTRFASHRRCDVQRRLLLEVHLVDLRASPTRRESNAGCACVCFVDPKSWVSVAHVLESINLVVGTNNWWVVDPFSCGMRVNIFFGPEIVGFPRGFPQNAFKQKVSSALRGLMRRGASSPRFSLRKYRPSYKGPGDKMCSCTLALCQWLIYLALKAYTCLPQRNTFEGGGLVGQSLA